MSTALEDRWTAKDERYLRKMWGWISLAKIAENLGRTETACVVRAKRLGIPAPKDWPNILMEWQLAPMLGHDRKTVYRLMKANILPTMQLWKRNTPCMAVDWHELVAWLSDPENWIHLSVDKVEHPELRKVIRQTRKEWNDRWLTIGEAANRLHITHSWLNALINRGDVPAKRHGNWQVKRSEVEAAKEWLWV